MLLTDVFVPLHGNVRSSCTDSFKIPLVLARSVSAGIYNVRAIAIRKLLIVSCSSFNAQLDSTSCLAALLMMSCLTVLAMQAFAQRQLDSLCSTLSQKHDLPEILSVLSTWLRFRASTAGKSQREAPFWRKRLTTSTGRTYSSTANGSSLGRVTALRNWNRAGLPLSKAHGHPAANSQ